MLYTPTVQQITTLLDHTRAKWPQLRERVDVAERLLLIGQPEFMLYSRQGLGASYDAWVCTGYRVDEKVGCHCPTYLEHKEADAIVMDRIFCAHLIAYHGYRRILLYMLNAGLALGFLHLGAHSQLHNGATAMPVITIVPCQSADPTIEHTFAWPADAGRFALWLGRQCQADSTFVTQLIERQGSALPHNAS
jgi:hypothetical protein